MTAGPPSLQASADEDAVRQSIFRQAQDAVAANAAAAPTTRQQDPLLRQITDLWTPEGAADDLPPPAYGDVYGEIGHEKGGLGTTALVADDGRVNIRINRLNHHLSHILIPALRHQTQAVQDSIPAPPPYVPEFLGCKEGVPLPPSMNVVMHVVGSRGDVQPFVALAKVLKERYGHRVRLATHPHFREFVGDNGLEFFSIGGDPSRLMGFMAKNPSLMPSFRSIASGDIGKRRKDVGEYIQGCWRSCYEAGDGMDPQSISADQDDEGPAEPEADARPFVADCIIANPPSFAHIHCAEKLGVPLHIMFTMPYSPTQSFAHPLANIQSSNADPQLTNFLSYAMIELLSWQYLGDVINRFRKKCLGLDPISSMWAPGMLQRLKIPHTYCWSPALIPKPKDWGAQISISGYYNLDLASNYTPAPDLQAFLDGGPTPIYLGFGSVVLDDPDAMTKLIFEAVRKSGQRLLLSKGWGGIGAGDVPDEVLMLDNVPHDWLFKRVSCVVHHGGAGTTAAGITEGRPTVVVPFFGDQLFWGTMLARAGAGPDPIPHKELTAEKLAAAINFCLKPETQDRATGLANKIAAEKGTDVGAQSFHQHLDLVRLRCSLVPSRPAVWRVRRTAIRLSAFAACTLANANLLDFHDLKLFRAREHYTDEGPLDPISGGFTAALRAFNGMAMGLADAPSETWKALQFPLGYGRQRSQAAAATQRGASRGEISPHVAERSITSTSATPSHTSLKNLRSNVAQFGRSASDSSGQLASIWNTRSSFQGDMSSSTASMGAAASSQARVRNQVQVATSKDQDRLRPTGPHTSKGVGRFVRALVQSPVDLSVSFTKGFHNVPKLWGDDTVRPQERVSDFRTGLKAVGREFGYGWYDGVTGLVTQPWNGARKDGAGGMVKGIGKGIGGFIVKPGAACMGILGHSMKGVHKEVQQLFGSNVQSYIIASRAAQGYEEWLLSSDLEIQDIIAQWNKLQKNMKKKSHKNKNLQDGDEDLQNMRMENSGGSNRDEQAADDRRSSYSADTRPEDIVNPLSLTNDSASRHARQENAEPGSAVSEDILQLQRQRGVGSDGLANVDDLRPGMLYRELEAEQHASGYREEKRPMAQDAWEQRRHSSGSELASISDVSMDNSIYEELERTRGRPDTLMAEDMPTAGAGPSTNAGPWYDPGHLAGTTQREFEAQQHTSQSGKTAQEKAEEDIVMEYMKKQSLLEMQYQGRKGKSRATGTTDEEE